MTNLGPATRVTRSTDAVWREIDGRAVVISLDDGRIRTLNPTGAALWGEIDGRSVGELVDALRAKFPARGVDELTADVLAFVGDLVARGMARVEG